MSIRYIHVSKSQTCKSLTCKYVTYRNVNHKHVIACPYLTHLSHTCIKPYITYVYACNKGRN